MINHLQEAGDSISRQLQGRFGRTMQSLSDKFDRTGWKYACLSGQVAAGVGMGLGWFYAYSKIDRELVEMGYQAQNAKGWPGISMYVLAGTVLVDGLVKIVATAAGNESLGVNGFLAPAIEKVINAPRVIQESIDAYINGPGWQRG